MFECWMQETLTFDKVEMNKKKTTIYIEAKKYKPTCHDVMTDMYF